MATTVYAPPTLEGDPKRQNQALQDHASKIASNTDSISTINTSLATLVVGPASSTNNGFVQFNGTTGKLVKDHAATIALGSEVSGNLPVANLNSGTSAGATTFWRGDATWTVPVLSSITNSLGADVALNNTANYFDGPSVAQGSTGTWFVSGSVTCVDTAGASNFYAKLWDGTTVIASGNGNGGAANVRVTIALSGYISSPAGNLRISVRGVDLTTGKIEFNRTGNSKDATISAFRIA